jgi:predicted nucleic acid-binding protein
MLYLLDTSALLAHHRQECGWEKVQALFEDEEAILILASVSLTEFGRRLHELGAEEAAVDESLSAYQLLFTEIAAVDSIVARVAFTIGCRTPHRLPLTDALIAATARTQGAVLVHRDEHMRSIPTDLVRQLDLEAASGVRISADSSAQEK